MRARRHLPPIPMADSSPPPASCSLPQRDAACVRSRYACTACPAAAPCAHATPHPSRSLPPGTAHAGHRRLLLPRRGGPRHRDRGSREDGAREQQLQQAVGAGGQAWWLTALVNMAPPPPHRPHTAGEGGGVRPRWTGAADPPQGDTTPHASSQGMTSSSPPQPSVCLHLHLARRERPWNTTRKGWWGPTCSCTCSASPPHTNTPLTPTAERGQLHDGAQQLARHARARRHILGGWWWWWQRWWWMRAAAGAHACLHASSASASPPHACGALPTH